MNERDIRKAHHIEAVEVSLLGLSCLEVDLAVTRFGTIFRL